MFPISDVLRGMVFAWTTSGRIAAFYLQKEGKTAVCRGGRAYTYMHMLCEEKSLFSGHVVQRQLATGLRGYM